MAPVVEVRWRRLRSQLAAKQAALIQLTPSHPCYAQLSRECDFLVTDLKEINDQLRAAQ